METFFCCCFSSGPVLERALDHVTHWRRPGFWGFFFNGHLGCRGGSFYGQILIFNQPEL